MKMRMKTAFSPQSRTQWPEFSDCEQQMHRGCSRQEFRTMTYCMNKNIVQTNGCVRRVSVTYRIPWQLLAVLLAEAGQVVGGSALLVWGRGERGGGLVAVGGSRRGGVVPLRGRWSALAALHQVGSLWEGGAPLLIRTDKDKTRLDDTVHGERCSWMRSWKILLRAACFLTGTFQIQLAMRLLKY